MSDFFHSGWSLYIAIVTILGILACIWLLLSQRTIKVTRQADGSVSDTGHVWDEDLRELNNPTPRWWVWMFLLACIFGLIYLVLYPGLGSYPGTLGYSTANDYEASVKQADVTLKPIYAKYMSMDIPQVAANPQAREIGQRLFLNHCAQCHSSDGGGAKGFPNLTSPYRLYGGDPEAIRTSITHGRQGVMPAWSQLSAQEIQDVANYVRSLAGLTNDPIKTFRGKTVFKNTCVACHGANGTGNTALGAPNLTSRNWLYGGSEATIIETVSKGRNGHMPAWGEILSAEKIHLLTAYVWGLSHTNTTRE